MTQKTLTKFIQCICVHFDLKQANNLSFNSQLKWIIINQDEFLDILKSVIIKHSIKTTMVVCMMLN